MFHDTSYIKHYFSNNVLGRPFEYIQNKIAHNNGFAMLGQK